MRLLRRHPPGPELGAWFDGEQGADDVGAHVSHCSRCRGRLSEMARVRAWIRAQPFFAMGDEAESAPSLRRGRPLLVAAALLVGVLLLVPNGPSVDRAANRSRPTGGGPAVPLLNSGIEGRARAPGTPGEPAPADGGTQAGPEASRGPAGSPLRLGLVVPTTGSSAREGAEVRRTVRRRVDQANARGGVGGVPVELVVVAAEDEAAVSGLPGRVTTLVGGFGAAPPPDVAWLFPADPAISGPNVVPAEPSPQEVGRHMGEVLRRQLLVGPVGVVVGAGPESAMGAGLASKVPTTTVAAGADSNCSAEIASLRRAGSAALAVAGPPDLAVRCLTSAARAGWRPAYGTFVAPSAAYGRVEAASEAHGARTLLALPWPTAPVPGAARFRASTSSRSYRALVSFAATELAIDVARQHGTVSAATVGRSTWRSDLFELNPTGSRAAPVVAGARGWMPAPEEARIGGLPLPPLPPPAPLPLPVPLLP